jgi:hypothetical protein
VYMPSDHRLIVEEASELRWAQVFFTQSLVLTEEHLGRPAVPILRLSSGRLPGKQTARRGRGAHSAYDGTRRSLDSFWLARDVTPFRRSVVGSDEMDFGRFDWRRDAGADRRTV